MDKSEVVSIFGIDPDRREDIRAEYAEKCRKACEGLPDGALDGGWTARGLIDYTVKLERELKRAIRQNECDMMLTGDELRQMRSVLGTI